MNKNNVDYKLYLVTDRNVLCDKDLYESIEEAIKGGVTIVQLREKDLNGKDFYDIALKVKEITSKYNIPLIINDRMDIALAVDAQGVHIGPDDIPIDIARKVLGPEKIIGYSASNINEALYAVENGADYLGVGAMYPTKTKNNTEDVTIDDLTNIVSKVDIPVVAIGGINEKNAKDLISSNIDGIAVVSAILGKENIYDSAKNLSSIVSKKL